MNIKSIGLYAVIAGTVIVAVINAISPFLSPSISATLLVIAGVISTLLHNSAVTTAVAQSKNPSVSI